MLELYEGLNEPGVPVVGGDTTRAELLYLSVTALGRSERVPGRAGRAAGRPARRDRPARRRGSGLPRARLRTASARLEEGRRLAAVAHALMDVSDGLAVDAGHIADRSGCGCVVDLERVPLAEGAELEDVGFGEDYELLAATPDALGFAVIGRCEEGAGPGNPPARQARSPLGLGPLRRAGSGSRRLALICGSREAMSACWSS